ncbi:MAG: hypothetical protein KGL39_13550 [Patescibacteria group bacterium]|nr:hypothetical protein [Patescibacteria group bacterium]
MLKKLFLGIGLLSGTIIGAGVFALPYVFSRSGWLIGSAYLLIFAAIVALAHLMYAEVVESTPGEHRLVGFSKMYLGKFFEWVATIISPIGLMLMLTVYLILGERFFMLILPGTLKPAALLLAWLIGTFLIFWQTKRLALAETLGTLSIAAIIFVIFGYGAKGLGNLETLPAADLKYAFLPYGVILFSYWGRTAIPPLVKFFKESKALRLARPAVIIGTVLPAILYVFFIAGVIGLVANNVTEDSVVGLASTLPIEAVWLVGVLGLLAVLTSYAVVGKNIYQTIVFDARQKPFLGGLAVALIPMLLYIAGFNNFIALIGVVGGIFVSIEGVLIVLLWRRVRREKKRLGWVVITSSWLLLAVFCGGILYELIYH